DRAVRRRDERQRLRRAAGRVHVVRVQRRAPLTAGNAVTEDALQSQVAGSVDAVAEEVRRLRAASHTDATVGVEAQAEHLLGRVAYDVRDRDLVRDRSVVGAPEHDPGTDAHAALTERDVAAITGRRDVGRV